MANYEIVPILTFFLSYTHRLILNLYMYRFAEFQWKLKNSCKAIFFSAISLAIKQTFAAGGAIGKSYALFLKTKHCLWWATCKHVIWLIDWQVCVWFEWKWKYGAFFIVCVEVRVYVEGRNWSEAQASNQFDTGTL